MVVVHGKILLMLVSETSIVSGITQTETAQFIRNTDIRFQTYRLDTFEMAPHIPCVAAHMIAIKDDSIRYPGILSI